MAVPFGGPVGFRAFLASQLSRSDPSNNFRQNLSFWGSFGFVRVAKNPARDHARCNDWDELAWRRGLLCTQQEGFHLSLKPVEVTNNFRCFCQDGRAARTGAAEQRMKQLIRKKQTNTRKVWSNHNELAQACRHLCPGQTLFHFLFEKQHVWFQCTLYKGKRVFAQTWSQARHVARQEIARIEGSAVSPA